MNFTPLATDTRATFARRGSRILAVTTVAALTLGASLVMAPAASAAETTGSISGLALVAGEPMGDTQLSLSNTADESSYYNFYDIAEGGTYSVADIAPGEYNVYISGQDETGNYSQYYGSNGVYGVTVPITVAAGEDTVVNLDVKYLIGNPTYNEGTGPAITGEGKVGSTLTYLPSDWQTEGVDVTVEWTANASGENVVIPGTSGLTLDVTQDLIGSYIQATETAHKEGFYDATNQADFGYIEGEYFESSGEVTIPEDVKVGQTVTADVTTEWSPAAESYSYEWKVWGEDEVLSTEKSFTIPESLIDTFIGVYVTAHRTGFFDDEVISNGTNYIVGEPLAAAKPVISGTVKIGSTLKVSAPQWNQTEVETSYQWFARYGKGTAFEIYKANKSSYKVSSDYAGATISVKVTGYKQNYDELTLSSASTKAVPYLGTVKFSTPKLSGTFKVGKTVKVKAGSLSPSTAKFDYAWLANGKLFAYSEKGSLKLPKSVKGKKISVVVTGYKSGYKAYSKTSKSSAKVK